MTPKKTNTQPQPIKIKIDVEGIRVRLGLTKKEMAQKIGISEQAIRGLTRNPKQIQARTIQGILNLGVTLDEIFPEDENS
jgi:transcriptional regulator with XRE-family HTH domain